MSAYFEKRLAHGENEIDFVNLGDFYVRPVLRFCIQDFATYRFCKEYKKIPRRQCFALCGMTSENYIYIFKQCRSRYISRSNTPDEIRYAVRRMNSSAVGSCSEKP